MRGTARDSSLPRGDGSHPSGPPSVTGGCCMRQVLEAHPRGDRWVGRRKGGQVNWQAGEEGDGRVHGGTGGRGRE